MMKKSMAIGVIVVIVIATLLIFKPLIFPSPEKEQELAQKTAEETPFEEHIEETTQKQAEVITLETFDWEEYPSWEIIDANSSDLKREYPAYLKKITPTLVWGERGNEAKKLIEENLAVKERIHANVYELNMAFEYRDEKFWPLNPEKDYEKAFDEFLRVIVVNGLLAKKEGMAVSLTTGFRPIGFSSRQKLEEALEEWKNIINRVAPIAEKYKFEYFIPLGELDNQVRYGSKLNLPEKEIVEIVNKYHHEYASLARSKFKGSLTTQLGDVYLDIKNSILSYDLSDFDLIGAGTGANILQTVGQFETSLNNQFEIMEEVSIKNGKDWLFSEVWIWGDKPITKEKYEKQAKLYQTFFNFIEKNKNTRFKGVGVRFWNQYEEGIFSHIIDTPSEQVIQEFF